MLQETVSPWETVLFKPDAVESIESRGNQSDRTPADGKELASEDIDKAAAEAGISARTVRAAKKNLDGRITSKRIGAAWYHALKK